MHGMFLPPPRYNETNTDLTMPSYLRPLLSPRWFFSNFLPLHPSSSIRLRNPFATPTWFANLFTRSRERPTIRGSGFTGFAGRTATRLGGAGVRANTVGGSTGSQSTGVSSGVAPPGGVAGAGSDAAAAREMRTRYNWGTGERLGGEGL